MSDNEVKCCAKHRIIFFSEDCDICRLQQEHEKPPREEPLPKPGILERLRLWWESEYD